MERDTAVCEVCGGPDFDNEDPETRMFWCRKCDGWRFFKWLKSGERHPAPRFHRKHARAR